MHENTRSSRCWPSGFVPSVPACGVLCSLLAGLAAHFLGIISNFRSVVVPPVVPFQRELGQGPGEAGARRPPGADTHPLSGWAEAGTLPWKDEAQGGPLPSPGGGRPQLPDSRPWAPSSRASRRPAPNLPQLGHCGPRPAPTERAKSRTFSGVLRPDSARSDLNTVWRARSSWPPVTQVRPSRDLVTARWVPGAPAAARSWLAALSAPASVCVGGAPGCLPQAPRPLPWAFHGR